MITLIMEAFVDLLVTEDWLTKETKNFAKQKVHTMKQKIGYPDYLNDSSAVDKEYAYFQVRPWIFSLYFVISHGEVFGAGS